jgi:hypothetical protein
VITDTVTDTTVSIPVITDTTTDTIVSVTDTTVSVTDTIVSVTDTTDTDLLINRKVVKNRHLGIKCPKAGRFYGLYRQDAKSARKKTHFTAPAARQAMAHGLSYGKTAIPLRPARGKRTEVRWGVRFGFQNPSPRPSPRWDGARESFALASWINFNIQNPVGAGVTRLKLKKSETPYVVSYSSGRTISHFE